MKKISQYHLPSVQDSLDVLSVTQEQLALALHEYEEASSDVERERILFRIEALSAMRTDSGTLVLEALSIRRLRLGIRDSVWRLLEIRDSDIAA